VKAFKDTWQWDVEASRAYQEMVEHGPELVSKALQAFQRFLGFSDMLAYLSMMAPRLVELRRVLKETGSIYLHCDPTASHYLKTLMDAVFGAVNFRNEIIWQRTLSKSLMTRRLPNNHDVILSYQVGPGATWNQEAVFAAYEPGNLDAKTAGKYRHRDADGRVYRLDSLINPNPNRPNLRYEFLGVTRVWRWTRERMEEAYRQGLVVQTHVGGVPQLKRYLDEQEGRPLGDVWSDIPPINSQAAERLGYPTQKPEALLERILRLSSREGQLVLDPFCGCGTTVAVAQRLGRRWIGIDVTHLAVRLMKQRLADAFGAQVQYSVVGEPTAIYEAEALAKENPYQFQYWALGLVDARPAVERRGADKGIDGRLVFHDDESGQAKQVILSVKAGHANVSHVRDLRGVLEREQAEIGCLLCLEEPTGPMRAEAAGAGNYRSPLGDKLYSRLQILTVKELLEGKKLELPQARRDVTFRRAPKARKKEQRGLEGV